MNTEEHHLSIKRVVDAPRPLVYRAFINPDDLAAWWGPTGNQLARDEMDFDVRPGGHQRWTEVNSATPALRVHVHLDLEHVAENELIEGVMRVTGQLQEGIEPFRTRLRVEFYDEAGGRTRIEIRQWLPGTHAAPSEQGWREALAKLDVALAAISAAWTEV